MIRFRFRGWLRSQLTIARSTSAPSARSPPALGGTQDDADAKSRVEAARAEWLRTDLAWSQLRLDTARARSEVVAEIHAPAAGLSARRTET